MPRIALTTDEATLLEGGDDPALGAEPVAADQEDLPSEHCRGTVRGDRYRHSMELRDR
jgi:DNA-binding GntR family transcriptional regulator